MLIPYRWDQAKFQPATNVKVVCNQIKITFNKAAQTVIYFEWDPEHM